MQIEQLKYFISIIEHQTYLQAAEVLNISQSSLSKKIIALENELDIILFDRSERSIVLTEAGKVFYEESQKMILCYEEMLHTIQPFTMNGRGSIKLATLPVLAPYHLLAPLQKFKNQYPNLNLSIQELEEEAIITGLKHRVYDLGIIRKEYIDEKEFDFYKIAEDELVALLPIHHPFSNTTEISLTDLKDESFIFMNKHTGIYTLCLKSCQDAGFYPKILQTARIETILSSVINGDMISLLMSQQLNSFNQHGIVVIPIKPTIKSELGIIRYKKSPLRRNQKELIHFLSNSK